MPDSWKTFMCCALLAALPAALFSGSLVIFLVFCGVSTPFAWMLWENFK